MENSDQEKEIIGRNQWKPVPKRHFLHTLAVGQYVFSKRSSSGTVATKVDETFHEIAAELNRMIDKLRHQPGGGDHPALDWVWKRLDRKLIKEFDMYMEVVDKSELLNLPGSACILDVTPAFGLMYSKIVKVPVNEGLSEDPALSPGVMDKAAEEGGSQLEVGPRLEQDEEAGHQSGPEVNGDSGLEQDKAEDLQPELEVNVDPGLGQDGTTEPQPEPEVNVDMGLQRDVEADPQPEPEVNLDLGLEQDGEANPPPEPEVNVNLGLEQAGESDLQPEVIVDLGLDQDGEADGMQAMDTEENRQVQTPKASPEVVRLVVCNIKMPRLEDMIEPEVMAVHWQKYNESTKLTADAASPNQPLKSILKRKPSQSLQKKSVRFLLDVEEEDNDESVRTRRERRSKQSAKEKIKYYALKES